MDKYTKLIIAAIILFLISVSLMIYFGLYYEPVKDDNAQLSPETNETNKSVVKKNIIEDKGSNGFEVEVPGTDNSKKEDNETNKSGYWVQQLPDSGSRTYSITPLVVYDKLGSNKRTLLFAVLLLAMIIYITVKLRRKTKP
jgi:hypothetical protein